MDSLFGSTLSLNGLLNDPLFCGVEGEEFLNELEGGLSLPKQQPAVQASSHTSSLSGEFLPRLAW